MQFLPPCSIVLSFFRPVLTGNRSPRGFYTLSSSLETCILFRKHPPQPQTPQMV